jgi:2-phosphoglycolate phosphatase
MTAILFDLDGTLVDTAPDMAAALNHLLIEEGLPALPLEIIRPHVSRGGLALTQLGFQAHRPEHEIEPLRLRFLDRYFNHIAEHSALFAGYDEVLKRFDDKGIPWGVVTNKPGWLTDPLMQQLGLAGRSAVTISGDTTAERKPHPLPLQTAARHIGKACADCLYIGDDPRDIQAGNAAGMTTVIARYGYITEPDTINHWQAQFTIDHPGDILALINMQ